LRRSKEQESAQGGSRGQLLSGDRLMPTAFVIDGAYFLRRFKNCFPNLDATEPEQIVTGLGWMVAMHMRYRLNDKAPVGALTERELNFHESPELYRIFFYDCPPLSARVHKPISKQAMHLANTPEALLRNSLHIRLRQTRKIALRLGRLSQFRGWRLKNHSVQNWLKNGGSLQPSDEDFEIDISQKGVDMRLGLDVAAMSFKRQVNQIIMVTGDSDFVPAAKLARREGIDVILDPMLGPVTGDLEEHTDGVRSFGFTHGPDGKKVD
jgi:uncharacterized LabA/DUF88 family protein